MHTFRGEDSLHFDLFETNIRKGNGELDKEKGFHCILVSKVFAYIHSVFIAFISSFSIFVEAMGKAT
jgi:hypothetical protein